MMRRWLLAACCSVILLAGCSEQTTAGAENEPPQAIDEHDNRTNSDDKSEDSSQSSSDGEAAESDAEDVEILSAVIGPLLSSTISVQQSDGIHAEAMGQLILNEAGGYYLYILPGYRAEIDEDNLILRGADHEAQVVIEKLPPQIDVQLAADELRTALQQLDENMNQITEYMRFEEWADAAIYRAYQDDLRITAIIKRAHGIPLRITITEPADVQEFSNIMAMLSTIDVEQIEMLQAVDENLADKLIKTAFSLQTDLLAEFYADPDDTLSEEEPAFSFESAIPALTLRDLAGSKEDIIAFLETIYTSEAAEQVAEDLGLAMRYGELRAELPDDGSAQLWDQAELTLVSQTEDNMRYLARIPLETEGASRLQEIELRKTKTGWRLHTPLLMTAEPPTIPEEAE